MKSKIESTIFNSDTKTISIRAINSAVVNLFKAYLNSLVSILLLVKVITPEEILVVISRVIILIVQIFESVKTSCFFRKVRLEISLTISFFF